MHNQDRKRRNYKGKGEEGRKKLGKQLSSTRFMCVKQNLLLLELFLA